MLGVCNNVLHETYRQKKKMVSLDREFEMASNAPGPDTCAMAAEIANQVQRMLSDLSPRFRAILKAALLEEQDRDEICVKFGVNRNHLRLLICRAKKTLSVCARHQMSGKSGLHLARPSRPKRRPVPQANASHSKAPESTISHPTTAVFLPRLYATDVPAAAGTWL